MSDMDMDWLETADIERKQRRERKLSRFSPLTYKWLVNTFTDFLPSCSFDEDNEGQIIIYTNVRRASDDTLVNLEV
jgi:hypothetical protein